MSSLGLMMQRTQQVMRPGEPGSRQTSHLVSGPGQVTSHSHMVGGSSPWERSSFLRGERVQLSLTFFFLPPVGQSDKPHSLRMQ